MQWWVIRPSVYCGLAIAVVHILALWVAAKFSAPVAIVASIALCIHAGYSLWRWVLLRTDNAIIGLRVQESRWQVKTRTRWQPATLSKMVYLGFLILQFQVEGKTLAVIICPDSVEKWREVLVAAKVRR